MEVFISYCSDDRKAVDLAEMIHAKLGALGISSFYDRLSIPPGEDLYDAITVALKPIRVLVIVVSESWESSRWTRAEAAYAVQEGIEIIPVRAQARARLPVPYNTLNALDFETRFEGEWPRFVARIQELLERDVELSVGGRARVGLRWIRWGALGLALAVALWVGVFTFGRQDALSEPPIGQALVSNSGSAELKGFVPIPSGEFWMGIGVGTEAPRHSRRISRQLLVSSKEVTEEQLATFRLAVGQVNASARVRSDLPAVDVDWFEASAYAQWTSEITGARCRLPSEAEWEYAALAGGEAQYGVPAGGRGSIAGAGMANCDGCGGKWDGSGPTAVGSFPPNAYGLYDFHGNVSEWVADCWHATYEGAPINGAAWLSEGEGDCSRRVVRGGAWSSLPSNTRASSRAALPPHVRSESVGFRVVCEVPREEP